MQLRFTVVALGERARFPPGLAVGLLNNNCARMVTSNNIRLQIPVGNATPQRRKSISATTSYHPSSAHPRSVVVVVVSPSWKSKVLPESIVISVERKLSVNFSFINFEDPAPSSSAVRSAPLQASSSIRGRTHLKIPITVGGQGERRTWGREGEGRGNENFPRDI